MIPLTTPVMVPPATAGEGLPQPGRADGSRAGRGDEVVVAAPPPAPRGGRDRRHAALIMGVAGAGAGGSAGALTLGWLALTPAAAAGAGCLLAGGAALRWLAASRRARDRARRTRYLRHLEECDAVLAASGREQAEEESRNHPPPEMREEMFDGRERVWERRPGHPAYLRARCGVGAVTSRRQARIDLDASGGAGVDQDLLAAARLLARRHATVDGVAVTVDVARAGVISIAGAPSEARALARAMLWELCLFHSPARVRVAAGLCRGATEEWDWMKWLPHARDGGDRAPRCLLAAGPAELRVLLRRMSAAAADRGPGAAHLLVVVDGFSAAIAGEVPFLDTRRVRAATGTTLLALCERTEEPPPGAGVRLTVGSDRVLEVWEAGPPQRRVTHVAADAAPVAACLRAARSLASMNPEGPGTTAGPGAIDVAGAPAHPAGRAGVRLLDLLDEAGGGAPGRPIPWAARKAGRHMLQAPIGVSPAGSPVRLDLSGPDDAPGHHGLVTGTDALRAAEVARTLVLALALMHSPDVVTFAIVDAGDGGAFAGLDRLPHMAGLARLARPGGLPANVVAGLEAEVERRADGAGRDAPAPARPRLVVVVLGLADLLEGAPDIRPVLRALVGRAGLGIDLLVAGDASTGAAAAALGATLSYRIRLSAGRPGTAGALTARLDAGDATATPFTVASISGSATAVAHRCLVVPFDAFVPPRRRPDVTDAHAAPTRPDLEIALERIVAGGGGTRLLWPPVEAAL